MLRHHALPKPPPQLWSCVSSGSCISSSSFFLYSRPLRLFIARWDDRKRKRHSITDMPLVQKFCQTSLFVPSWRGYEEAAIPPSFPQLRLSLFFPADVLESFFHIICRRRFGFSKRPSQHLWPFRFCGGCHSLYIYIYICT